MQIEIISRNILNLILNNRRLSANDSGSQKSHPIHLQKIMKFVAKGEPVTFILPAFPAKSPNTNKVVGHLPDMAEKISLEFLNELTKSARKFYAPGIKIIICSDGRVFSDAIGIKEEHVSEYQKVMQDYINELNTEDISLFCLDKFFPELSFAQKREILLKEYGASVDFWKSKIRENQSEDSSKLYLGLVRFLFEDALHPEQTLSRSQVQKEAKERAFLVMQRSQAWSAFLEHIFPESIRLSIHPHSAESEKLGIKLFGQDAWKTPWHGVALETKEGFELIGHKEAKTLNARPVMDKTGRISHFSLLSMGA